MSKKCGRPASQITVTPQLGGSPPLSAPMIVIEQSASP
jgi:hypothetical protein